MWGVCVGQGHLTTVVNKLARYKLDLVGVQEVRWDKGGTARAGDYTFSMEKGMKIVNIIIIIIIIIIINKKTTRII